MNRRVRFGLAVVFLLLGLGLLVAAFLPLPRSVQVVPLPLVSLPTADPPPVLLENRHLVLEWPDSMRAQDSAMIALSIRIGNDVRETPVPVKNPDLSITHNLVAVARLEMAGLNANQDEILIPMTSGQPVNFRWHIRANTAGVYPGTLWLHLQLVPKSGGPIDERLLLARSFQIKVETILGLSGNQARILGGVGLTLSAVFGYPLLQNQVGQRLNRLIGHGKPPPGPKEV